MVEVIDTLGHEPGKPTLFHHRRRSAGLARPSRRQLPLSADDGAGLGRPRPRRRDAVPGALRPLAAAPDRARPGRHPLRHVEQPRRRSSRRDRAAAVGAQRADPLQPGDRRSGAHAGRQSGARSEDAARRHHQRGARRQDRARRQGGRAGRDHEAVDDTLSRPGAHGGARRRHRPRDAGAAGHRAA